MGRVDTLKVLSAGAIARAAAFFGLWLVLASSTRFRPIMLTAVSTVLGMIPIAPTVFWGPMAFAIMGGLLVGAILTLVFLPTLYVTWFRGKESAPAPQGREPRPATA